ncbi:TNF receptor-associated factor 6-like [Dysidea avara]|uniref:TNF receptor-associated factor 6-like n=1 Tax=Dysidea avara TaxID=196820 RepID=UPI0033221F39
MATGDYDNEFCSTISEQVACRICPSQDPYQNVCCGHVSCKSCVDKAPTNTCLDEEFPTAPNKLGTNSEQDQTKDRIVSCANDGCSWRDDTQAMEEHEKTCPREMVECEYHSVGCMAKVQRRHLKEHNKANVEEHLALSMSRLRNLESFVHLFVMNDICGNLFEEASWSMGIESLAIMATSGDKVCPVILKMSQFPTKKAAEEKWFSNPFYTHNKGYKMCLCIDTTNFNVTKGNKISDPEKSVNLHIMKGPYDDKLSWPLRGEFKVILLNQLDDLYHRGVMVEFDDDTPAAAACRVVDGEMASIGFGGEGIWLDDCDSSLSSDSSSLSSDSSSLSSDSSSSDTSDEKDPDWLYLKDDCMFFQVMFETN